MYILDLGPAYQGYFADNCRAVAVNHRPTDEQSRACAKISEVFTMIEQAVKPGVRCRDIFDAAQAILDEYRPVRSIITWDTASGFIRTKRPHLNPKWDDSFEVGDVFTAEPGLYGPEFAAQASAWRTITW